MINICGDCMYLTFDSSQWNRGRCLGESKEYFGSIRGFTDLACKTGYVPYKFDTDQSISTDEDVGC
jgi:hypothetical protein